MREREIGEQPTPFTFETDALVVAQQLKGAVMHTEVGLTRILDTKAFPGYVIDNPLFARAMGEKPGTLTAVPYRGSALPNITTADHGLVMITAIALQTEEGIKLIKSPGRVAKSLDLSPGETRKISIQDPISRTFQLEPQERTTQP